MVRYIAWALHLAFVSRCFVSSVAAPAAYTSGCVSARNLARLLGNMFFIPIAFQGSRGCRWPAAFLICGLVRRPLQVCLLRLRFGLVRLFRSPAKEVEEVELPQ